MISRSRVLLIDEVYVKPTLTYHTDSIFGKAVNKPNSLATTILSFMIVSLFGGPQYLCRILPVYELDSTYLFDQANFILDGVKQANGELIATIFDNNRVNQTFIKNLIMNEPWLTKDGMFLLFDFVHILKSVRNNWITEKCQKLSFEYDG